MTIATQAASGGRNRAHAAGWAGGGGVGELGAHVPPDEVDEVRLVRGYLESHPELPQLPLDPPPGLEELGEIVARPGEAEIVARSGEGELDDVGGARVGADAHRWKHRNHPPHPSHRQRPESRRDDCASQTPDLAIAGVDRITRSGGR